MYTITIIRMAPGSRPRLATKQGPNSQPQINGWPRQMEACIIISGILLSVAYGTAHSIVANILGHGILAIAHPATYVPTLRSAAFTPLYGTPIFMAGAFSKNNRQPNPFHGNLSTHPSRDYRKCPWCIDHPPAWNPWISRTASEFGSGIQCRSSWARVTRSDTLAETTLLAIPSSPLTIPGFIIIGPFADVGMGVGYDINAKGKFLARNNIGWSHMKAKLDISSP
ncbi:hypothetical protein B0H14DRAFT_2602734 [Mycena olivaceomarginata]|nr:hypothetical protein B0H14DRAFT_2602734 [Mycena olivaceomarginata]